MTDIKQTPAKLALTPILYFEKEKRYPFVGAFLPMLCFIEQLALSWTCKQLLQHKPNFHFAFDKFMLERGIDPKKIRYAMQHGLHVTGSTLHQIFFGLRYRGSDIDMLDMGTVPEEGFPTAVVCSIPRPDYLKGKELSDTDRHGESKSVFPIEAINPHFHEDEQCPYYSTGCDKLEYDQIVPVTSEKYVIIPRSMPGLTKKLGEIGHDGLEPVRQEVKKLDLTCAEMIHIDPRVCPSVLQFVDRFCDISFCKVVYNGRLKVKHMDHLFTRSFEVFWETERYAWRTPELMSSIFRKEKEAETRNKSAKSLAKHRVIERWKKYTERGFVCLNPLRNEKKKVRK